MTRRSVSSSLRAPRLPVFALAAALGAASVLASDAESRAHAGDGIDARMKEIYDFNHNGVVKIQSTDPHGHIDGTGFYADSTGTIYTGLDVVGDGSDITVFQGMRKMPARLEVADPRTGIAILKVDTTTPFLPIGDSSKVDVYTPLVAIGYPFDKSSVWSGGIVVGLDKKYLDRYFHTTHLRAKLPVQPGFGGSPVLNLKGEVVGIVVAGVDQNTGCYILPINAAEKIRTDFKRFHRLKPGWVGISVEAVDDNSLPSTARVTNLQPGPAEQAGLQEGDILLRVGDIAIHTPEDIFDASFFLTAGDETPVTVLRKGAEQKLTLRAAENPSNPAIANDSSLPDHSSVLTLETSTLAPVPQPTR